MSIPFQGTYLMHSKIQETIYDTRSKTLLNHCWVAHLHF
jgi:hypothetical protein